MKVIIVLIVLASAPAFAQKAKMIPMESGRFRIVQISDFRRDQFLIDTQTGQLWTRSCISTDPKNCEETVWTRESIEGVNITRQQINWAINQYEKKRKENADKAETVEAPK